MKFACSDIKLSEITECRCDYRAPEETYAFDGEILYKEKEPFAKVVSKDADIITLETINGIKQTIRISLINLDNK